MPDTLPDAAGDDEEDAVSITVPEIEEEAHADMVLLEDTLPLPDAGPLGEPDCEVDSLAEKVSSDVGLGCCDREYVAEGLAVGVSATDNEAAVLGKEEPEAVPHSVAVELSKGELLPVCDKKPDALFEGDPEAVPRDVAVEISEIEQLSDSDAVSVDCIDALALRLPCAVAVAQIELDSEGPIENVGSSVGAAVGSPLPVI